MKNVWKSLNLVIFADLSRPGIILLVVPYLWREVCQHCHPIPVAQRAGRSVCVLELVSFSSLWWTGGREEKRTSSLETESSNYGLYSRVPVFVDAGIVLGEATKNGLRD